LIASERVGLAARKLIGVRSEPKDGRVARGADCAQRVRRDSSSISAARHIWNIEVRDARQVVIANAKLCMLILQREQVE
jgi:hypothetical protein